MEPRTKAKRIRRGEGERGGERGREGERGIGERGDREEGGEAYLSR